jgi:RHS repeat-associated protein
VVTDADGVVVESTEFYPYGRPRHEERIGFESAYKYTGKELDQESGLMYFEARYYEPVVGRFVSVDPLVGAPPTAAFLSPEFIHTYAYAGNNPIMFVDPDGKFVATAIGAGIGAAWGALFHTARYAWSLRGWRGTGEYAANVRSNRGGFWKELAWQAKKGALAGAITGGLVDTAGAAIGSVLAVGVITGAVGGFTGAVLEEEYTGWKKGAWGRIGIATAIGGVVGMGAGALSGHIAEKVGWKPEAFFEEAYAKKSTVAPSIGKISALVTLLHKRWKEKGRKRSIQKEVSWNWVLEQKDKVRKARKLYDLYESQKKRRDQIMSSLESGGLY